MLCCLREDNSRAWHHVRQIEYHGDIKEVVRVVLQVVANRIRAGRAPAPESVAALVPDVLSRLRIRGSIMTKGRADSLLEAARDRISGIDCGLAVLNGQFSDEQLDAVVFLMHSARDCHPTLQTSQNDAVTETRPPPVPKPSI